MKRVLDDNEVHTTMLNALWCAASEYRKLAVQMHAAGDFRLATQFETQAKASDKLAGEIEQAAYVVIGDTP